MTALAMYLANTPSLLGIRFLRQMLRFELDAQGALLAVTATNSIEVRPGAF